MKSVDQPEPLFLISRFNKEEEALAIANASNVGLAGENILLNAWKCLTEYKNKFGQWCETSCLCVRTDSGASWEENKWQADLLNKRLLSFMVENQWLHLIHIKNQQIPVWTPSAGQTRCCVKGLGQMFSCKLCDEWLLVLIIWCISSAVYIFWKTKINRWCPKHVGFSTFVWISIFLFMHTMKDWRLVDKIWTSVPSEIVFEKLRGKIDLHLPVNSAIQSPCWAGQEQFQTPVCWDQAVGFCWSLFKPWHALFFCPQVTATRRMWVRSGGWLRRWRWG